MNPLSQYSGLLRTTLYTTLVHPRVNIVMTGRNSLLTSLMSEHRLRWRSFLVGCPLVQCACAAKKRASLHQINSKPVQSSTHRNQTLVTLYPSNKYTFWGLTFGQPFTQDILARVLIRMCTVWCKIFSSCFVKLQNVFFNIGITLNQIKI